MPTDSATRPSRRGRSRSSGEQSVTARDFARAIEEDVGFQARSWRVQRFGWLLWAVIILVALVGLLGGGPLSRGEARSADGRLAVEYDRFARPRVGPVLALRAPLLRRLRSRTGGRRRRRDPAGCSRVR